MRVIAGSLKGRTIAAPKGRSTRPTSDRVREALFSSLVSHLGSDLGSARVLDAFAGSGALGIEALSRGAEHATFVERDSASARTLRANVELLDVQAVSTVVVADITSLARRGSVPGAPFSLLFADPPYRIDEAEVRGLVDMLAAADCLKAGAVIVWEHDANTPVTWPECVRGLSERRYGSTTVSIGEYARGTKA